MNIFIVTVPLSLLAGLCTTIAWMYYESLNSDFVIWKKHKSNHFFEKFYRIATIFLLLYGISSIIFLFYMR